MKQILLLFVATALYTAAIGQNEHTYARYPAISPDGNQLAFSYQGDIWTSSISGGLAQRITIHEAYESHPVWSPDGSQLAFSSNRFGNNDVFVMSALGGPKRITYHSASDIVSDWTSKDELLFESNRTYRQVEWDSEMQRVSSKGGTPSRLMDAFGEEAVASPNGKLIAFTKGACRTAREQYKGSANKDIWVYNTVTNKYFQITTFNGQDYHPVWGSDTKLYFISSRAGKYNVFSTAIDTEGNVSGNAVQVSKETEDGVRYFDVSADNSTIVYEKAMDLYALNIASGKVQQIKFTIATDYRFDPYENKTYTSDINEYAVSPNGKYSAFVIHGEVFITENDKDKKLTKNISNTAAREKDVAWLNDSVVVFSSDRDGNYDLYLSKSADKDQTDVFKTLKRTTEKLTKTAKDEHSAQVSPDGKKITFIRGASVGAKAFVVADIDENGKISAEKILQEGWNGPSGVRWSPDSKWLAFSMEDLTFNEEVYIQQADGKSKAINVSMHPRGDFSPVWSPDGSKLGFVSARNNSDNDIWYVWLRKEDWQKTEQDWDEGDEEKKEEKKDDKKDDDKKTDVEPIQIDVENIHERLVQLTSLSGSEGNLAFSKDGKTIYFSTQAPGAKGSDLYEIQWDKSEMKEVTKGGRSVYAVRIDHEGKYLYCLSKGSLSRIKMAGNDMESLPISAKMTIHFKEELNQVFEEGWRALRDGFYDPEFHGQDWDALKKKYKPYCMAASTRRDFFDMYNNMLGQLNASHMGIHGKDREDTQSERTGLLGVEVKPTSKGVEVAHVVLDSPADRVKSKLNKGDIILSVDGVSTADKNFWALLTNTANEKVLLEVADSKGAKREVVIRPTTSLGDELYDEWVKERRALVDKYSGGRLGYLHIRGMSMPSFERFERELTAAGHGKEAIVIDVRYNGGGWTTDYLMAILNVKQHAYTIPRGATNSLSNNKEYRDYYPFAERLPFFAWNKPSIALCNENSYSNAEIFSHAYKNLGIGTLVGRPTFGAVISTGGMGLVDGSFIRMPFRAWFVKADDKNMEIDPAVPNIDLDNSIDAKAKGVDEQLKRACDELIKQLDNK